LLGPDFKFRAPRLIFYSTEGARSSFQIPHSRTFFWRYQRCRVPFSSCALRESFSTLYQVMSSWTIFWRYRWRGDQFLSFALLQSFSAVRKALGPIFKFRTLRLIFGCSEGVGSSFQVSRSYTHFWQLRGRQV
jgi:hypothetical protein